PYFLFQAEDGIRDFHVTGVQTCALPILHYRNGPAEIPAICCFYRSPVHEVVYVTSKEYTTGEDPLDKMLNREMEAVEHHIVHKRSEERRVGKECSQRLSSCDQNNNCLS